MEHRIVTTGIGKSYKEVEALVDVNLTVGPGRILGVLGHNGAGKTTLVDILSTRCPADTGIALVCGWDVTRKRDQVCRRIGVARQITALDENLSGRDNLTLLARLLGATAKQARARAGELLVAFGLEEAADRRVRTYSGGMRRRVDLAVSLLGQPEVLFLDEPSAGLDPVASRQLWSLIKSLANTGITVMLTTQYLAEAESLADEVLVLSAGRVVASGSPEELKRRVGSQLLSLAFADAELAGRAIGLLREIGLFGAFDPADRTVVIPVHDTQDIVTAMRAVDIAQLEVSAVHITEPTLEDVYLTLYGAQEAHR